MGGSRPYRPVARLRGGQLDIATDENGVQRRVLMPRQQTAGQTRRLNSTRSQNRNQNASNQRERMMNGQAVQQVRDMAREFRTLDKEIGNVLLNIAGNPNFDLDKYIADVDKRNSIETTLATLANQVQQGTVPNVSAISPNDRKNIEKVLGVKLS